MSVEPAKKQLIGGYNPGAPTQPEGPIVRKLKKGEILFAEGENSRSMYYLKSGMIRIFKKKGESAIEIGTVRSGEVLGELAFLDGNPRSASGEALTDCELMEISSTTFQQVLGQMPDWLKILLKAVVGRLRAASTRIRQLETASTAYDTDKDGKRSAHYVYLSPMDVLKSATALLLTASRHSTQVKTGYEIKTPALMRYGNQILGIPEAKLTTFLDVLTQAGFMTMTTEGNETKAVLTDVMFIEKLVLYLNEENLAEPAKRHDVTLRGFLIMGLIAKHLAKYPKDEKTGLSKVNIAEICKAEAVNGKDPFRLDEVPELAKLGYMTAIDIKDSTHVFTNVRPELFLQHYRFQRVVIAINSVNEQKRKGGKAA